LIKTDLLYDCFYSSLSTLYKLLYAIVRIAEILKSHIYNLMSHRVYRPKKAQHEQ